MLNLSGDYRVTLEYEGCREGRKCLETLTLDTCPGLHYDCRAMDLQVTSCTVRESEAIIDVTVPKPAMAAGIRPYKDLRFYLKSNLQDLDGVDMLPGVIIERKSEATFRMTFPLRKDEIIGAAAVTMKDCDSPAVYHKLVQCNHVVPPPTIGEENLPEPEKPEEIVENAEDITNIIIPTTEKPENEGLETKTIRQPKQQTRPEFQVPVVIIPLHIVVLVVVIGLGIGLIVYSFRSGHKKVKEEEE